MTSEEAFRFLGLEQGSSKVEIRRAWRSKSTVHHPDSGGSNESMVMLNLALERALAWAPSSQSTEWDAAEQKVPTQVAPRIRRDVSSFTVNVLPVECWLALEIVASLCGPTIHDDPPHLLEFLLHDSSLPHSQDGWCRCECIPEAGATTVHLTVGGTVNSEVPDIDIVRDYLVEQLNQIDWPN